jgi:hypothetical protein
VALANSAQPRLSPPYSGSCFGQAADFVEPEFAVDRRLPPPGQVLKVLATPAPTRGRDRRRVDSDQPYRSPGHRTSVRQIAPVPDLKHRRVVGARGLTDTPPASRVAADRRALRSIASATRPTAASPTCRDDCVGVRHAWILLVDLTLHASLCGSIACHRLTINWFRLGIGSCSDRSPFPSSFMPAHASVRRTDQIVGMMHAPSWIDQ